MKCSFHPKAKDEFLEAIDYYKSCGTDLDLEFVNEIYSTIQRIIQFPTAWSRFSENTRRCLTRRFPFGIIYHLMEDKDEIVIIAVMQVNRKPDYWKKRLKY
ncbi:type II toxin-antitoxin system RelE/ParE family toxin [Syntrophaceticus schinkii]|jgi:plasmid stabilization system protein ParE|uniref:Plasmid stabilization system protein n=1 Tax=Syntrophaceticus schinkii TaxID=499207 RepID=A0A0B7MMG5_9FIRM|nr:Plasmid stabilization system protein [Syntrophaceticus schinkii]